MTPSEAVVTLETEAVPGPAASDLDEWLDWRMGHIGASETGAAMGVSKWQQPLDIYNMKTGLVKPPGQNFPMWWGTQVEAILAQAYTNRTGKELLYPIPGFRHQDEQHIGATPDAVRKDNQRILVEMKAAGSRVELGSENSDEIPADWIAQAQAQMFVMDADIVEFAVVQSNSLGIYVVERNEAFIEAMVERLTELWEKIGQREPPDADWEHATTGRALAALIDCDSDFTAPLGGYEQDLVRRYEELGRQSQEVTKDRDQCKHKIMASLSGHAQGRLPDGRVLKMRKVKVKETIRESYEYKRLVVPKRKDNRVTKH